MPTKYLTFFIFLIFACLVFGLECDYTILGGPQGKSLAQFLYVSYGDDFSKGLDGSARFHSSSMAKPTADVRLLLLEIIDPGALQS